MRIIAGKYKGRTLLEFKGYDIRPTSDRARESLFDILQLKVPGCAFLDLFCGTGAVGIEALSRGAKKVVLNDVSRESVKIAKQNVAKLNNPEGITVTNFDAETFVKSGGEEYDVIFLDPPYKSDAGLKTLTFIKNILKDDGIVVFESETPFDGEADGLTVYDSRRYGRACFTFFRKSV